MFKIFPERMFCGASKSQYRQSAVEHLQLYYVRGRYATYITTYICMVSMRQCDKRISFTRTLSS